MSTQPFKPCTCSRSEGTGYLVTISYPASPLSEPTLCCSCTVDTYRALYGEPSFAVTPAPLT